MSRREKIIIALAIVAVSYGAYSYLVPANSDTSPEVPREAIEKSKQVSGEIREKLKTELDLSSRQLSVLEEIRQPWPKDPFMARNASQPEKEDATEDKQGADRPIVYSGFVRVGGNRYAVINGNEYTTGDSVRGTPFTVLEISRDVLVLKGPQGRMKVSAEGFGQQPGKDLRYRE
jgi:hypothetical protein